MTYSPNDGKKKGWLNYFQQLVLHYLLLDPKRWMQDVYYNLVPTAAWTIQPKTCGFTSAVESGAIFSTQGLPTIVRF
jgi:hypothetical protein